MIARYRSLLVLLALAVSGPGLEGQVSARAAVDRNPVAVNQPFVLSVAVSGVQRLDADPQFPDLGGFARFLGSGSSTAMQVVNGVTSTTVTNQYRFLALREGVFQIPSLEVRAGGGVYRTQPIELTITATPQPAAQPQADDTGIDPEDVFLETEVSQRRVFENEALIVEYRIFTRIDIESYGILSPPSVEGFWVEEIPAPGGPAVETLERKGLLYTSAALRRVAVFPTGPGTRTIQPLTVEARIRVQRRGGLLDDLFGSRLLGNLTPVTLSSDPVEIEVLPLPVEGRPSSFTGLVGELAAHASLDRSALAANEAATLRVEVSGSGNLRTLRPPELALDSDFEVFDPEIDESLTVGRSGVSGTKSFEYVVIPRAPGVREIPPIELGYFDPVSRSYVTTRTSALTLDVTGEGSSAIPGPGFRSGVETLRTDIRFIRLGDPGLRPARRGLARSSAFWIVVMLPLLGVMGATGYRTHRNRLEGDVAYARGRRAGSTARKRLAEARKIMGVGNPSAFYGAVAGALQGFLADKLNLPPAGMMSEEAAITLRDRGVPGEVATEFIGCVEHCDRRRFAPGTPDTSHEGAFLERAERALHRLDEALSR